MQKLSSPIKLIQDSFKIFFEKGNLVFFLSVYLLLVPFRIFSYFQSYLIDSNGYAKYSWSATLVLIVNLLFIVVYFLTLIMSIEGMKRIVDKSTPSFKKVMIFARKNMWGFFLVTLLVFLATFGGIILLIIPGIIFGIWFSQSTFVFVDQGLGVKSSLLKSKELVKNRFWAILGRYIVFGLFTLIVEIVLNLIPFKLGGLFTTFLGALFILPSFLLYKELSA